MAKKFKDRQPIPSDLAAKVLFRSDRTCCVCRQRGKPVQIHHIDEKPANNTEKNLAVLCFDCHRDTQITGGFDRKLDADQVVLYRDDWLRLVDRKRSASDVGFPDLSIHEASQIDMITTLAEIYRENEEYEILAHHYDSIGNYELRDKYVELAIRKTPTDSNVCSMRILQGKPELIPPDVVERRLAEFADHPSPSQRARFYRGLGRYREAATDYVSGVLKNLQEGAVFPAAYYLKELFQEGIVDELFCLALNDAEQKGDLWWQVRALEELGWLSERDDLVRRNADEIEASGDHHLLMMLARARGDHTMANNLQKSMAQGTRLAIMTDDGPVFIHPGDETEKS